MLRNVAIPLMLAASEAEAQTADQVKAAVVKMAMDMDEDFEIPELIAVSKACTSATDTDISALDRGITSAQTALETAQGLVTAAVAPATVDPVFAGGAWTQANVNRIAAIEAAEAVEVSTGAVGILLDALNTLHDEERRDAALYYGAKLAFEQGETLATTTGNTQAALELEKNAAEVLSLAADAAVLAATAAIADEKTSRGYLYCELGAVPAFTGQDAGFTAPMDYWTGQELTGAQPADCDVPQVLGVKTNDAAVDATACTAACSAEATCDVSAFDVATSQCTFQAMLRPQITYHHDTASLASETTTAKWNATLALTQASLTITQANTAANWGSLARTFPGIIQYYEGVESKYEWLVAQRTREHAYFEHILALAATAKTDASAQTTTNTTTMPSTVLRNAFYGWPANWGQFWDSLAGSSISATPATVDRFAEGFDGSAHALLDKTNARDSNSAGSAWRMPNTRTQQADGWPVTQAAVDAAVDTRAYVTIWTDAEFMTDSSSTMNDWIDLQLTAIGNGTAASASPLYKWWITAREASEHAKEFNTLNVSSSGEFTASVTKALSGTSAPCVVSTGTWSTAASSANEAGCLALCVAYTISSSGLTQHSTVWNNLQLPKVTTDGSWCSAYSYTVAGTSCQYLQTAATVTSGFASAADVIPANASSTWALADTGASGDACYNLTAGPTYPGAVTAELLNFVYHQHKFATAFQAAKDGGSNSTYDALEVDAVAQAGLETFWLQAYYYQTYWLAIEDQLEVTMPTTRAGQIYTYKDAMEGNTPADFELMGATALQTANTTLLTQARNQLAFHQVDIALKQAHVDLLGVQLNRTQQQIDELLGLTTVANVGTGVEAGELIAAQTERNASLAMYTAAAGADSVSAALTAKTNADAAILARDTVTYTDLAVSDPNEGALFLAQRTTLATWVAKQGEVSAKEAEITEATTVASLDTLRAAVVSTAGLWSTATDDLTALVDDVLAKETDVEDAEKALAAFQLACQVTAYDIYRANLEDALAARQGDLDTIKLMLEGLDDEPAPGTVGSRCEKALSNGTYRPQRGESTCGGEGFCCGAARVWMSSGTTAGAAWRTIETCQADTTETYSYVAPRSPMQLTQSTPESLPFACIEGAKALAAAASAAAAAVYMLA